jgi:hypothetical protein
MEHDARNEMRQKWPISVSSMIHEVERQIRTLKHVNGPGPADSGGPGTELQVQFDHLFQIYLFELWLKLQ